VVAEENLKFQLSRWVSSKVCLGNAQEMETCIPALISHTPATAYWYHKEQPGLATQLASGPGLVGTGIYASSGPFERVRESPARCLADGLYSAVFPFPCFLAISRFQVGCRRPVTAAAVARSPWLRCRHAAVVVGNVRFQAAKPDAGRHMERDGYVKDKWQKGRDHHIEGPTGSLSISDTNTAKGSRWMGSRKAWPGHVVVLQS